MTRLMVTTTIRAKVAFDCFEGVAIFTTNDLEISEPIKRRMSYCMEFKKPGPDARLAVLKSEVVRVCSEFEVVNATSSESLERFSRDYSVAGGFMAQSMMLAVAQSPDGKLSDEGLETALRHQRDSLGVAEKDEARTPTISLERVKLEPANQTEVTRFIAYARRALDAVKNPGKTGPKTATENLPGASILLSGPPGTGKTLTAEAIASELKIPIRRLSPSSLLSMWVGGTEQRIRKAFREAECEPCVLMIDEAEGLFASRAGAQRSWEVTQANELLQQVESFKGVLAIATNYVDRIDPAFARRFIFHLRFEFPGTATRLELWKQWQSELKLTDAELATLAERVELTGGEIRNAAIRALVRGETHLQEVLEISERVASDRTGMTHKRVGF